MTTLPSGSTVFPGGTRQDLPSLEKVVPAGQRHVPAWHTEPPRQTTPQAPHEVLDVARLVQLPEQHATAASALQAAPHEPQFCSLEEEEFYFEREKKRGGRKRCEEKKKQSSSFAAGGPALVEARDEKAAEPSPLNSRSCPRRCWCRAPRRPRRSRARIGATRAASSGRGSTCSGRERRGPAGRTGRPSSSRGSRASPCPGGTGRASGSSLPGSRTRRGRG